MVGTADTLARTRWVRSWSADLAKIAVKRAEAPHLPTPRVFSKRAGIVFSGGMQGGLEPVFRELNFFGRSGFSIGPALLIPPPGFLASR